MIWAWSCHQSLQQRAVRGIGGEPGCWWDDYVALLLCVQVWQRSESTVADRQRLYLVSTLLCWVDELAEQQGIPTGPVGLLQEWGGIINRPSMWLSPNPTATTTLVSTHVNYRSLSRAASQCPLCVLECSWVSLCLLWKKIWQNSRVHGDAVAYAAHIGIQCQILSVWSLHSERPEMYETRELGKIGNRNALSHQPLQTIFIITPRRRGQLHQPKKIKLSKYTQM